jgi:hypothetical protein
VQPARFIDGLRRGNRQGLERVGHRLQVAPGEVEIQHRMPDLGMAEQQLDRAEVGPRFEQMRGKRMAAISSAT